MMMMMMMMMTMMMTPLMLMLLMMMNMMIITYCYDFYICLLCLLVLLIFSMTMTLMLLMILNNAPPGVPFPRSMRPVGFPSRSAVKTSSMSFQKPCRSDWPTPQKNRSASKGPEMKNQRFSHVYMFIHMCIYIYYFILYLYLFQKYQKYIRKRRDIFFWKHGIWVKFQTLAPQPLHFHGSSKPMLHTAFLLKLIFCTSCFFSILEPSKIKNIMFQNFVLLFVGHF